MHALPQMHAAQACLFKFNRLICNENKSRTDPSFKLPFTTQNNGGRAQILNLGERQNDFRIDFGWNFLQAGAILRLFCASQIWGQWRPPFATDEASVEPGDAGWGGGSRWLLAHASWSEVEKCSSCSFSNFKAFLLEASVRNVRYGAFSRGLSLRWLMRFCFEFVFLTFVYLT